MDLLDFKLLENEADVFEVETILDMCKSDVITQQEAFEKCWAHLPLRAAARPNFTLPFARCRYCRTPPAHMCPRQQQRQRVTEGTIMAP